MASNYRLGDSAYRIGDINLDIGLGLLKMGDISFKAFISPNGNDLKDEGFRVALLEMISDGRLNVTDGKFELTEKGKRGRTGNETPNNTRLPISKTDNRTTNKLMQTRKR